MLQENAMVKMKTEGPPGVWGFCLFPLGMSRWLQNSLSGHPDQAAHKGRNANFIDSVLCSTGVMGFREGLVVAMELLIMIAACTSILHTPNLQYKIT